MPADHSQLLQRLRRICLAEAEAQRRHLARQWALPDAERVGRGLALEGLRLARHSPPNTIVLKCTRNDSRFREGDLLRIHQGDPEAPGAIRATLEEDAGDELVMSLTEGDPSLLDGSPFNWWADEDTFDLTPFYLDALDQAADTLRGRETVLPLLTGDRSVLIDYARYERGWEAASEAGLNDTQAEAVGQSYATNAGHLIQGPPGTGKTRVLAHLARLLVEEGQRVLVTAFTHRAINNALNTVSKLDPALPVCKVGRTVRADDLLAPNEEYFIQTGFGDLAGGYIVGATPFATQTERLSGVEFDVVIFDEASQVTLPLAIMGMLAGSRYIFIGDERQLPPVTRLRDSALARTSIFGYLQGRLDETMLTETYRLNDRLTDWPSRTHYSGLLHSAPAAADRRLELDPLNGRWEKALDPEQAAVFINLDQTNTTVRSRREAETVCELVLELLAGGISLDEIGVVVPYRAQARLIRNLVRPLLPAGADPKHLVVDTVERMQGQEREAVILSLTTSSPAFAAQLAEFFFQPERLNVAVTRARTKLIIVGSEGVTRADPGDPELDGWINQLADLLESCKTLNG